MLLKTGKPLPRNKQNLFFLLCIGSLLPSHTTVKADHPKLTAEKLFDAEHLVDIQIELPEKDWNALRQQTRSFALSLGKKPAERSYEYFKGHITIDGVRIKNVGIRKKGFLGSLNTRRPSLKIKFREFRKQKPVKGIDRLTLNNNQQDRSLASQYLCYRFFNETETIASRCNHAKVTVNGQYLGIYSNVESVRPPFLKTRFDSSSGDLYEGTVADLFPDSIQRFESKTKGTSLEPLEHLAGMLDKHPLDMQEIEAVLDVSAFVKFWATESLIGFWDGYTNNQNNYFVYKNPRNSKLYFMPWGLDSALTSMMPLPPFFIKTKSVHSKSVLANRLYRNPDIQQQYRETLLMLLDKHWNEKRLLADLDRLEVRLKDHLHSSQKDFPRKLNSVRRFISGRRKVIQKELSQWPVTLTEGPRGPIYFKSLGQVAVTFSTQWYQKTPESPFTTGTLELKFSMNGEKVRFKEKELGIYVTPENKSDSKSDPSIVIIGRREPDDKQLTLSVSLPASEFRTTKKKRIIVEGNYVEGTKRKGLLGFIFRPKTRVLAGFGQFKEASRQPGASVSGTLELHIMEMKGGKPR